MNHPYGIKENRLWPNKLIYSYEKGQVTRACFITYAATSEAWSQPTFVYPQCFLVGRQPMFTPEGNRIVLGKTPGKGHVITYLGDRPDMFHAAFADVGAIKIFLPPDKLLEAELKNQRRSTTC